MNPKWNSERWQSTYTAEEFQSACDVFNQATNDEAFRQWYQQVEPHVTMTTPSFTGGNVFILYFHDTGNLDAIDAAIKAGWQYTDRFASRTVYERNGIKLIDAEHLAIIVSIN